MAKYSCPTPLPEEEKSTRLISLLEPKPVGAAPFKGQTQRKSSRGIRICEPQSQGASHTFSGKEEISKAAGDVEEEEEEKESSSDKVRLEAPDGQASTSSP